MYAWGVHQHASRLEHVPRAREEAHLLDYRPVSAAHASHAAKGAHGAAALASDQVRLGVHEGLELIAKGGCGIGGDHLDSAKGMCDVLRPLQLCNQRIRRRVSGQGESLVKGEAGEISFIMRVCNALTDIT